MKTVEISFDDFVDEMVLYRERKVMKHHDDQVILVCGYEGTGKSTFSLATMCEMSKRSGIKPNPNHIFYTWNEYLDANYQAALSKLKKRDLALVQSIGQGYGIDIEELLVKDPDAKPFDEGDILLYDEAATQAFNREAMSKSSIDYVKLMVSNRFLNLFHLLNVPKPTSIDKYIREQRARLMIWCDASYSHDMTQRIRNVYVYSKDNYMDILYSKRYWLKFNNTQKLVREFPPEFKVEVPNLLKYIPKNIQDFYDTKKAMFNVKQIIDMMKVGDEEQEKELTAEDIEDLFVRQGESKLEWSKRTKKKPTSYKDYKDNKEKLREGKKSAA